MIVKRFDTEKAAEKFARAFDHARAFNHLAPLRVVHDGEEWGVENPGNIVRMPVPKREPVS
jgi:hypothetical protein